jgi:nucleoside-diphosphate-sugar epimerase
MTTTRPAPAVPAKVFITGANGFIGKALAARLRELGAEVTGVDLVGDPANGIVQGTTTDPDVWKDALDDVDVVVHTAAIVSTVAPIDEAWEINVMGTRKVLDAAKAAGVKRFVHLSSVAAYGFHFPDGIDETYPTRVSGGVSSYQDTKVNSEAIVLAEHASGGLECVVIRPCDVYGPGSVWVREPLALAKANQMILPDGGKGIFDVVYIDNFVDGMVLSISAPQAAGQVFNIGERNTMTCGEYFGRIASWSGKRTRSVPIGIAAPLLDVVGGLQRKLGKPNELGAAAMYLLNRKGGVSIEKARTMLGYEPIVGFEEGIQRCEEWARSEGLV